jgi:hypothetical protein
VLRERLVPVVLGLLFTVGSIQVILRRGAGELRRLMRAEGFDSGALAVVQEIPNSMTVDGRPPGFRKGWRLRVYGNFSSKSGLGYLLQRDTLVSWRPNKRSLALGYIPISWDKDQMQIQISETKREMTGNSYRECRIADRRGVVKMSLYRETQP